MALSKRTQARPQSDGDRSAGGQTVLAVDVGGTTIKAARVDRFGYSHSEITLPTGVGDDAIGKLLSVCEELRDSSTVGAALAVPGIVDHETGDVRKSVNLQWLDVPLARLVENEISIPTTVVHDVRAACTAEVEIGVGKNVRDMLIVAIGTGLSAGIVAAGAQVTGATFSAGEIGHLVVQPGGEPCVCGQFGCVEVYSSAGGILRRYEALGGDPSVSLSRISSSRDPIARQVWADATNSLARAFAATVVTLDPALIVIAGGLSLAGERLTGPVRAALGAQLAWRAAPEVVLSELTSKAGLVGAAIEAWKLAGAGDSTRNWSAAMVLTAPGG